MLGLGTAKSPFLVSTEEDLYNIRNNPNANYKLTDDIYMKSYQIGEGWEPIPDFHGGIDGSNYTIYDLYINRPNESVGFIRNLEHNALGKGFTTGIFNLNFENVNIVGGTNTGTIAGTAKGFTHEYITDFDKNRSTVTAVQIRNCKVSGELRSASGNMGGIIGKADGSMTPSAWNDSQMVNVSVSAIHTNLQIHAFSSAIGGLVGDSSQGAIRVETSSTRGNIHNGRSAIGGILGIANAGRGHVLNSYSHMDIQAGNYVGGIIGRITAGSIQNYTFKDNYFAGTISAPNKSTTQIGAGHGYFEGVVNGDGKLRILYDEEIFPMGYGKYDLASKKNKNVTGLRTSEMKDIRVFIDRDFDILDTWYAGDETKNDYLHLKSEFNQDRFEMFGEGTKKDPYQIRNVDNLISITKYDSKNWDEYNDVLQQENHFHSPHYKENLNFSKPDRFHYELTRDIDLDVYPWNVVGWFPLTKVKEQRDAGNDTYESLPRTQWNRRGVEASNGYKTYDSIGNHTGFTDGENTIGGGNEYYNGVGMYHKKGFMGILNGKRFKIKNLLLRDWESLERIGLFEYISGGTVENLLLTDVKIDVDYYRSKNKPKENLSVGVVANRVQSTSTIQNVSVSGTSKIKDYRSDVNGAGVDVSGFVYATTFLDRTPGYESRFAFIKNSSVSIENTMTNVDKADDYMNHFSPLVSILMQGIVDRVYSSSKFKAKDSKNKPLSGTHGNKVLIGRLGYRGKVLNSYYDSEVVNAESGEWETTVLGEVEIYGRSTRAMKLQATYVGWDFSQIWGINGVNYPSFKPYDPNYKPPVNTTSRTILTKLDTVYMVASSDSIKKRVKTVNLVSYAKRNTQQLNTKRVGSTDVTTELGELYAIAFAYDNPNIGEVDATTSIDSLRGNAEMFFEKDIKNLVSTYIGELETSVEIESESLGAFYNGISVQSIRNSVIMIKVNDSRIKQISYPGGTINTKGSQFVSVRLEESWFDDGDNKMQIIARDIDEQELLIKTFSVVKEDIDVSVGDKLLIDGKYNNVASVDGVDLTLQEPLIKGISRLSNENSYLPIEVSSFDIKPSINGIPADFIGASFKNGLIEEKFELDIEAEITETTINMSRGISPENLLTFKDIVEGEEKRTKASYVNRLYDDGKLELADFKDEANIDEYKSISENNDDAWAVSTRFDSMLSVREKIVFAFTFNIIEILEENLGINVPGTTLEEKTESIGKKINKTPVKIWDGYVMEKIDGNWIDTTGEPSIRYWNYETNDLQTQHIIEENWEKVTVEDGFENKEYLSPQGDITFIVEAGRDIPFGGGSTHNTNFAGIELELEGNSQVNEVRQVFIPRDNNKTEL